MRLPGQRSLTSLLADSSIWINYHATMDDYGETASATEIALAKYSFLQGRWMLLGTLIHELAHVNGAAGYSSDKSAETALVHCGLGREAEIAGGDDPRTPFDPGIEG